MPNRIIKESIQTSDTLASISAEAERLFWRLVTAADDYGRFDARPHIVLGKCLAAFVGRVDTKAVCRWLDELEGAGLIRRYMVGGKPYLHLTTWDEHQRPPRAKAPKYPSPQEADSVHGQMTADAVTCGQVTADAPDIRESGFGNRESGVVGVTRARDDADDAGDVEHIDEILARVQTPDLDRYFQTHFGTNAWNLSRLKLYVERGFDEQAVIYALQLQQERDQHSRGIRLACSILDDWRERGISTREAAEAYERAFRQRRRQSAAARADPEPEEHLTVDELQRRRRERGEYVDGPDAETVRELARAIGRTPT